MKSKKQYFIPIFLQAFALTQVAGMIDNIEKEVEAESGKNDTTEKTEKTKEAPETGDDSHAEMWMFTMLGSFLALLILGKKRYGFLNK